MFDQLHSTLKLDRRDDSIDRPMVVSILESEGSDSSFLLHHFLSLARRNDDVILVLNFRQTQGHYYAVASKIGNGIKGSQIWFLDVLKHYHRLYPSSKEKIVESEDAIYDFIFTGKLDNLLHKLQERISEFSGKQVTVLIDDLSGLLDLGVSLSEITKFVMQCSASLSKGGTLVVSSIDNELSRYIAHLSDLLIRVWPLKTGYYSDSVTGNLEYRWKYTRDSGVYQFKTTEKSVSVFALGTSSAVL